MESSLTASGLPRTVSNPVMGVTVTFLTASDETEGQYAEAHVMIPAGHQGPPAHFHTDFEETFTSVEGTLFLDYGEQRGLQLTPGEAVHVEPHVRHRYYNDGDAPAVFRFVARPGQAYEDGIRAGFGLANDGRTDERGVPRNLLEMAAVFSMSKSYVAGAPLWLQRALTAIGVRLATWRGLDPTFAAYTRAPADPRPGVGPGVGPGVDA